MFMDNNSSLQICISRSLSLILGYIFPPIESCRTKSTNNEKNDVKKRRDFLFLAPHVEMSILITVYIVYI